MAWLIDVDGSSVDMYVMQSVCPGRFGYKSYLRSNIMTVRCCRRYDGYKGLENPRVIERRFDGRLVVICTI